MAINESKLLIQEYMYWNYPLLCSIWSYITIYAVVPEMHVLVCLLTNYLFHTVVWKFLEQFLEHVRHKISPHIESNFIIKLQRVFVHAGHHFIQYCMARIISRSFADTAAVSCDSSCPLIKGQRHCYGEKSTMCQKSKSLFLSYKLLTRSKPAMCFLYKLSTQESWQSILYMLLAPINQKELFTDFLPRPGQ